MDIIFVLKIISVKKIVSSISIRGLRSKVYYLDEYIVVIFFSKDLLLDRILAIAEIIYKVYIINNLKASIFIRVDILTPEYIILDFTK